MRYELQIPALTTLTSSDATSIRVIVNSLVSEFERMNKEIEELKNRPQQNTYEKAMRK
jgi:hypothetical protein